MNIIIFTFEPDTASVTQLHALLPFFEETKLIFDSNKVFSNTKESNTIYLAHTDKESVHYEQIDEAFETQTYIKADILIFLTKHASASGVNSLSCHTQGNWAKAEYGGAEETVAPCPVRLFNEVYLKIKELNTLDYDSIIEVTHHGPNVKTPSLWIEIGSDEKAWANEEAGKILANVVMEVIPNCSLEITDDKPVLLCIGGMHHGPNFAKRIERHEAWVSHICPKYMLDQVTKKSLLSAIENSVPRPTTICYDWKSMAAKEYCVPIIEEVAEEQGLKLMKVKEFKTNE